MNLHQIKIDFRPEEDRLLLAIATAQADGESGKELLLWLTRRCVKLLWPALMKLAASTPDVATQQHAEARDALVGMRHEAAVQKSDFSQSYEGGPKERPLGEEPILVARIQYRAMGGGQFVLTLLPAEGKGQGVNLTMDETLLHSFCRLLQAAVAKADWDMRLDLPRSAGQTDVPGSLN